MLRNLRCYLLFVSLLFGQATFAQTATAPPTGDALVESVQYLRGLKTYYVEVVATRTTTSASEPVRGNIWYEAPNRYTTLVSKGSDRAALYLGPLRSVVFNAKTNEYMDLHSSTTALLLALSISPCSPITVVSGIRPTPGQTEFLGVENVAGVTSDHFRVPAEGNGSIELWIARAPRRLPVFARASLPGKVMFEAIPTWVVDQPISPATFEFVPPAGARAASASRPASPGPGSAPNKSREPVSPLIGRPAPDFSLPQFNGMNQQLSMSVRRRRAVMLVFWATWCGACRAALPEISEIGKDYGAKGVDVFAVNSGEKAQVVQSFVDKSRLALNVLLDGRKEVVDKYLVSGYPTIVIIGRDGVVRNSHFGVPPKQVLARELDAVLAAQ